MMQQLFPDGLGRILHEALYQRMLTFAKKYTADFPAEGVIQTWLNRFYAGDPTIIILADIEQYKITAHALIELQHVGGYGVVMGHQLEYDTKKTEPFDICIETLKKLKAETHAHCICLQVTKNQKVYEKKYHFKAVSTLLMYTDEDDHAAC
jgi:hypothetical protein